jgi:hypothetical protein
MKEGFTNKELVIPIELTWDYLGLDQSIDEYESEIVKKVTGGFGDFEVTRFAHAPTLINDPSSTVPLEFTDIQYEFYFTPQEIYYYTNNFSNSFFKLDLYDNVDEKRQTNYITIIIPTQQGLTKDIIMQRTPVKIKKPKFVLDYVGDKEGFFIYWLKKRNFLDITTFYMSAKFYDAKNGFFTKMINMPQSSIPGNKFVFDNTDYFYYRVQMDYDKQTYQVFSMNPSQQEYDSLNKRAGATIPIKWYEYVNPQ